ncbi:alpha-L-rhamnosidase [Kribbella sp. VKM Ac-2527]|uniref:alpha-L-rhamnosidase n=1 Tax=Kribbella caucasensis TaxID=2512215 RepID=A0A4R6KCL4_9ACTN|nr:family 78 glycoside hydrolase catalytic domain [Kribbella sp. VKM Ac-2527]TDO47144.1 alpha-L-rhamnosidase [Kribbella sp. VKM Ac-2527]
MSGAPDRLRIDSGGDQFTVSGAAPRLSWRIPRAFTGQSAYELEATVDGTPLARVARTSKEHLFIAWPWAPRRSCQRVTWRVRVRSEQGLSDWSASSAFEVGLLNDDWTARWISPVEGVDEGYGNRPAYALSTRFEVSADVLSARLYATALGVYEAFVNGHRAGTAELTPGSTSYDRTLYAQAMDVTDALRQGSNEVEVLLSDGWYRGKTGGFRLPSGWGTTTAARLELHLWNQDGTRTVVRSGERWTSRPSKITRADLMDGQSMDLGSSTGPSQPVLIDQVVAPGIDWSPAPPVRRIESRPPASLRQIDAGTWVADFGQNASGWISLADLGPAGTRTVIDHGEFAGPDGELTTAHLDSVLPGGGPVRFVQRDEVVSAGGGEVFEPRHTVHGFQYARLRRDSAELDPASVTMHVVHSDLTRTGTFECANADINRLHDIAVWSFRGNAVDVPTDCPTRERLGWTGDYQVFAPAAARLYDVHGFTRKWLRSVRDDQLSDGRIANFSPDGRRTKLHLEDRLAKSTGSAGWGDAIVAVPIELYETYGDREVLAENWEAMVRWVEWTLAAAHEYRHPSRIERSAEPLPHEEFIWDGTYHWGEWCEPRTDPPLSWEEWQRSDKGEVGTAYLYRSSATLARIAAILDRPVEAERHMRIADQVRAAWRTEFLDDSGRTTGDSQAGYVRALAFGLVPEEVRGAVVRRLIELIRAAGNHLGTGFLSTGELLPVLADSGYADVAYDLLFQRTSPSWLAMLDRGATTIWEDWDGVDDDGNPHESLNHYSKGAVVHFLHTHVLGLRQANGSAGWESFVVSPVPHPDIPWARGTYESPQGTIEVAWHTAGGTLQLEVDVPPGSTAEVIFPHGETTTLPAGRSTLTRPTREALR